jgi:hypothetical protein
MLRWHLEGTLGMLYFILVTRCWRREAFKDLLLILIPAMYLHAVLCLKLIT